MVLEPNLHLRGRQPYDRRQVLPLGGGEVSLLPEPPLELVGLRLREEDPPLSLLVNAPLPLLGAPAVSLLLVEVVVVVVAGCVRLVGRSRVSGEGAI